MNSKDATEIIDAMMAAGATANAVAEAAKAIFIQLQKQIGPDPAEILAERRAKSAEKMRALREKRRLEEEAVGLATKIKGRPERRKGPR